MKRPLVALGLAGALVGCSAQLSPADQARIAALETSVKQNSDKIAEQSKEIDELKAAHTEAPATPVATPTVTVTESPAPSASASASPSATPTAAASVTRDINPTKATNGRVTMWVTRLAEYHSVDELGPLIRMGSEEKKTIEDIKSALSSQGQKIVVLWVNMSNVSAEAMSLGCSNHLGPLILRGSEGTQVPSSEGSSMFLTKHIEGGFPYESLTPPKGSVSGRLCFVVKDWLEPTTFFPEDDAHLGPHPDALAIKLK